MVTVFLKSANQPNEMFSANERLETGNSANGKEISAIPFGTEKEDYLRRKPTISE